MVRKKSVKCFEQSYLRTYIYLHTSVQHLQLTPLTCRVAGNIDQVQYCDKVKNITDFLGMKLSIEELTKIWKMQVSHVTFVGVMTIG